MDRDGNFAWLEYIDYINFRRRHPEVTDPEVLDKMLKRRYTASDEDEAVKQDKLKIQKHEEGVNIDDEVMKVRFEDWMKECDKTYPSEEEKARRYKVFKENTMAADKANASFPNGAHLAHLPKESFNFQLVFTFCIYHLLSLQFVASCLPYSLSYNFG